MPVVDSATSALHNRTRWSLTRSNARALIVTVLASGGLSFLPLRTARRLCVPNNSASDHGGLLSPVEIALPQRRARRVTRPLMSGRAARAPGGLVRWINEINLDFVLAWLLASEAFWQWAAHAAYVFLWLFVGALPWIAMAMYYVMNR